MATLDRISIAAIGSGPAELAEQASSAQAAGIDCIWAPELFRSSVTQATWLAAQSETVDVGNFIRPEQIGEYQRRIIEGFGPAG